MHREPLGLLQNNLLACVIQLSAVEQVQLAHWGNTVVPCTLRRTICGRASSRTFDAHPIRVSSGGIRQKWMKDPQKAGEDQAAGNPPLCG